MEQLYFILFLTSIILIFITLILAPIMDALDLDGNFDLPFEIPLLTFFPLNMKCILVFTFVTGGVGHLASQLGWNGLNFYLLPWLLGIAAMNLLYRCIILPLQRAENTSAIEIDQLIGSGATVIETILENGFGKISYTVSGTIYNAPAKHIEGKKIIVGSDVVICKIENFVFFVADTVA